MKLNSLDDLLRDQLKDLYSAENQLLKALPKLAKKATSESLAEAFTEHLEETELQVERLNSIAKLLGVTISGKKCKAMEGLVQEGKEALESSGDGRVVDAALIAAAQRVEHYEISSYGTARALAEEIGLPDVAELLQASLEEESAADEKLTTLAVSAIYPALQQGEPMDDEDEMVSTNGKRSSRAKR
jgi:ferritin-like metal-binding protein YciE